MDGDYLHSGVGTDDRLNEKLTNTGLTLITCVRFVHLLAVNHIFSITEFNTKLKTSRQQSGCVLTKNTVKDIHSSFLNTVHCSDAGDVDFWRGAGPGAILGSITACDWSNLGRSNDRRLVTAILGSGAASDWSNCG